MSKTATVRLPRGYDAASTRQLELLRGDAQGPKPLKPARGKERWWVYGDGRKRIEALSRPVQRHLRALAAGLAAISLFQSSGDLAATVNSLRSLETERTP